LPSKIFNILDKKLRVFTNDVCNEELESLEVSKVKEDNTFWYEKMKAIAQTGLGYERVFANGFDQEPLLKQLYRAR